MTKTQRFYKATRPDGYDFATGTVKYEVGKLVRPKPLPPGEVPQLCGPGYLHVATTPSETLVGGSWPCRLFLVEGKPLAGLDEDHPHKAGLRQLKVLEELPAWQALGPNGQEVVALIERAKTLTEEEAKRLYAAREATRDAARGVAWYAVSGSTRYAAWNAVSGAVRGAGSDVAWALLVRDLIGPYGFTQEHYDALTRPWREVIGKLHPDD